MTVLCLASYFKGVDFLKEAKRQGSRVLLITVESLAQDEWPRDMIDGFYYMPDLYARQDVINAVSYLARTESISRIVALDEFDLEMAATLREHLRVRGMGESEVRRFRDKLVMREAAAEGQVPVPEFTSVIHYAAVAAFLERVPAPWVLKPRTQASAIGIRKLTESAEVWRTLEQLGDEQSNYLLEQYIPGDVFHVDAIVADGTPVFAEAHGYAAPPLDVMHAGGLFSTRTVPRGSEMEAALLAANERVVHALRLRVGAVHTEFIRGRGDDRLYFLETAARVGGANIVETVEAATGVNLWREWAKIEIAVAEGHPYVPPERRLDHAAVIISLARQEWPDTSAYDDPEVVWRMRKRHHAGLIVASPDPARVDALTRSYMDRFMVDFFASLPAPDRPTA